MPLKEALYSFPWAHAHLAEFSDFILACGIFVDIFTQAVKVFLVNSVFILERKMPVFLNLTYSSN